MTPMIHLTLNGIASLIICGCAALLIIDIYGSNSSPIHRYTLFESWLVKFGLSAIAAGSLFNIFYSGNPPFSEVILNAGLALFFLWVVMFYRRYFKIENPIQTVKKVVKEKRG